MATQTQVSVEEYLNTSYSPDCDYIDGQVLERNVGEKEHSRLQILLAGYLLAREQQWGIVAFTEQRVQVAPTRFRIPDLCVLLAPETEGPIFVKPPFLCIEILSREDRFRAMQEKIDDYLGFGVKYVWVIDPMSRKAHVYHASGVTEAKDSVLSTSDPDISVSIPELYRPVEVD